MRTTAAATPPRSRRNAGRAFSPASGAASARIISTQAPTIGLDCNTSEKANSEDEYLEDEVRHIDYDTLAGSLDMEWLDVRMGHLQIIEAVEATDNNPQPTRARARALDVARRGPPRGSQPWPRRSWERGAPDPPTITKALVEAIEAQDVMAHPDAPVPPAAAGFLRDLSAWHEKLVQYFKLSATSLAMNLRNAALRIQKRISFLPRDRVASIMNIILKGYMMPLTSEPPAFHRAANGPDLSTYKAEAWAALSKDISHGAIIPCNLAADGKPHIVSPVRTAPKGWKKKERRFIINLRFLNQFIPEWESSCELETLSQIRNYLSYPPTVSDNAWFLSMDMASGYHNIRIHKDQWRLLGIALHVSELPPEAVEFLRANYPESEDVASATFYFLTVALPFGLGPSCRVFSEVATAFSATWRRHEVCNRPVRLSSYIDDYLPVAPGVRAALILSIELVYEFTAVGITLNIAKCRLAPATRVKYLGIIINSRTGRFSLPSSRVERMNAQLDQLAFLTRDHDSVPARLVAQFVGLLWAATPCCPRAVSVMARGMISVLTKAMRRSVWNPRHNSRGRGRLDVSSTFSLKRILAAFWDGDVQWTTEAEADLLFWCRVDFANLSAPISADTLAVMLENVYLDPSAFDLSGISFLASDASETACGGGHVLAGGGGGDGPGGFRLDPSAAFFSPLARRLLDTASAIREAVAILWMLRALERSLLRRVVVFCDSLTTCRAIVRGSRSVQLHAVVRDIFIWCLRRRVVLFPCWVPRTSRLIDAADQRSRWIDTYDDRSPPEVFWTANELSLRVWGDELSFDRQASHLNVMPPGSSRSLPFNALWQQPGCQGVDMFAQPRESWQRHLNFIHPARPTTGRVLSFLPFVGARAIVVFPAGLDTGSWWANWARSGGPGVLVRITVESFVILAVDHSGSITRAPSSSCGPDMLSTRMIIVVLASRPTNPPSTHDYRDRA